MQRKCKWALIGQKELANHAPHVLTIELEGREVREIDIELIEIIGKK